MMQTETRQVDTEWLPQGGFLIWAQKQEGYPVQPMELKYNLFAWHRSSYYGTMLETVYQESRVGVQLPPRMALEFFGRPCATSTLEWQWSKEIQRLQKLAPQIQRALAEGRWQPDFQRWQRGERAWLLEPGCLQDSLPYLDAWVSGIINEMLEQEPKVEQAWGLLTETYPLLQPQRNAAPLDETDWQEAVGLRQDDTPFRTCLQLLEPEAGPGWPLQILLQDKQDETRLVELPPYQLEEVALPEDWLPYRGQVERISQRWIDLIPWLADTTVPKGGEPRLLGELSEDQAWEFLDSASLQLVEAGHTVLLPRWWEEIKELKPKLKLQTRSSVGSWGEGWLSADKLVQFDWKLAVGDLELSEEEFRQLAKKKRRLLQIRGQWIQLDPELLRQVLQAARQKQISLPEMLQMHYLAGEGGTAQLEADPTEGPSIAIEVALNKQLTRMVKQLGDFSEVPLEQDFSAFQGTLRHYQVVGASWLLFLRRFGLGGCLADDMGLGKTIQWIAYLLKTRQGSQESQSPSLLICPTSVLGNWQKELERFAPELRVLMHYGSQRAKGEELAPSIAGYDLVITTYNLAHLDEEELSTVQWDCICLDEAQNIKNVYTKQAAAVRKLPANHRVALTGTPMENRLTELWSIMDFLNPGYLGSLNEFRKRFVNVIEKKRETQDIERVQRLIRPFLLRRVKSDPAVELDLPDKQELKEYIPLTAEQASLYEQVLQNMLGALEEKTGMARRGLILATLTRLKQICDHPALFMKEANPAKPQERSQKVSRLLEMVESLRQQGDKCLIFTQYSGMGKLLQQVLERELGERVFFLHGGTPQGRRDEMVEIFQRGDPQGDCGIFILSLKAGGVGLNLTAANHVFHFDRWWNPAVENQATDRSHRIGQEQHVLVHKFISLGTLEERIDEMIERKQALNQQIVGGGEAWITELGTQDLKEIFALRRQWVEG